MLVVAATFLGFSVSRLKHVEKEADGYKVELMRYARHHHPETGAFYKIIGHPRPEPEMSFPLYIVTKLELTQNPAMPVVELGNSLREICTSNDKVMNKGFVERDPDTSGHLPQYLTVGADGVTTFFDTPQEIVDYKLKKR